METEEYNIGEADENVGIDLEDADVIGIEVCDKLDVYSFVYDLAGDWKKTGFDRTRLLGNYEHLINCLSCREMFAQAYQRASEFNGSFDGNRYFSNLQRLKQNFADSQREYPVGTVDNCRRVEMAKERLLLELSEYFSEKSDSGVDESKDISEKSDSGVDELRDFSKKCDLGYFVAHMKECSGCKKSFQKHVKKSKKTNPSLDLRALFHGINELGSDLEEITGISISGQRSF